MRLKIPANLIVLCLLASSLFIASGVAAPAQAQTAPYVFDHAVTALNWQNGSGSDFWNLVPVDPRTTFNMGDKVYLLVQTRNVVVNHRYKVELYRSDLKQWDFTTQVLSVGSGWTFSNFYPYYENAQPGSYVFKVYIDIGNGFNPLVAVPFTVEGISVPYVYHHTYIASGWQNGTGTAYWDLKPVNVKTVFIPGETVYALAQVRNIYVSHRWKVELYRGDTFLWNYTTATQNVGSGWTYGNFTPFYANAQPGNYEFKIYLDINNGFKLLDTKSFSVSGTVCDYTFFGAVVAAGWANGTSSDFWNIRPVDPRTNFAKGENVYLVAQARDVRVDHRWKIEVYRQGTFIWDYTTPVNKVGSGWAYSNFDPANFNSAPGEYQFKLYIDTGLGFKLLDTKNFSVSN